VLILVVVAILSASVAVMASGLDCTNLEALTLFGLGNGKLTPHKEAVADPAAKHGSSKQRKVYLTRPDRSPRVAPTVDGNETAVAEALSKEGDASYDEWTENGMRNAIEKFRTAVSHWHAAGNTQREIQTLIKIGDIYVNLGEYHNALLSYDQALSQAATPQEQSECLNSIASVNIYLGDQVRALSHCKRAYQLSRQIDNPREQARALNNQGEIYYVSGNLQRAAESLNSALTLWPDNDSQGKARTFLNLGYTAFDRREMEAALSNYQSALQQARSGNNKRNEALALTAVGGVYSYLGNKQNALDYHSQALKLFQRIGDHNGEGVTLNGLGYVYRNLGEYQKSLDCYLGALKLFRDLGNLEYENFTITCVGRAYQGLDDNVHALEYFQLALDRSVSYSQTKATALNSMGMIFEKMGEPGKAMGYYGRALALYQVIDDRMGQASILDHLGNLYLASGKNADALRHYRKALALSRLVQEPSGEASALFKIASALLASGDDLEARRQIEDSIKIIESLRMKVASQNSRASYFASTHEYYELYVNILMSLNKKGPDEGLAAAAFEVSEKGRARSFLESLKEARSDIREGIDPSLSEQERKLGRELNFKAEQHLQLLAGKKTDLAKAVTKEIDQLTTEYEEVRAQIRSKNPRYAALTEPQQISLKEIQNQLLDDDSVLLEYMLGEDKSYLWLVTRDELSTYELPGRAKIEELARSVYELLTASQPIQGESFEQRETRVVRANEQLPLQIADLSRILLEPVAAKLKTKRLLIVADGALQYIPFQVLDDPSSIIQMQTPTNAQAAGRAALVAAHEIVNEPSASALELLVSETKNRKPASHGVAVFGDPVFEIDDPRMDSAAKTSAASLATKAPETEFHQALRDVSLSGDGMRIPRLQASREEADAIMSVTPWRSGFQAMGFEASRAMVMKADLGNYRIVHFATHGLLNNEHPELSGIVLSLFDRTGQSQDGFLRLHDIYNLKLPVDLVVLSACNTGLGKDVKGEGLIGLTRGFMYAGASSVVASLWKVDDEATAELMRLFYGYMLRDGLSPAAALRKAQVTMSQQKRWQSPYYWAGFVIQGQYVPSEQVSRFLIPRAAIWLIAATIVGAAAFYALRRRRKIIL
jgi:CHAT domain-containing protein/Flp pilus assembly protein TadD